MSLIRQVWLLLLATVLLSFIGSIGVATTSARDLLQTQVRQKNSDNAAALALALSQQNGDGELMDLLMTAQFDTGYYRRVQLRSADGKLTFSREVGVPSGAAPAWFVQMVPISSQPGTAQVSDGWRALGQVLVESQVSYVHAARGLRDGTGRPHGRWSSLGGGTPHQPAAGHGRGTGALARTG